MPNSAQKQILSFADRSEYCTNQVGRKLLSIMEKKRSNLAVNPDVIRAQELVDLAQAVGPHICILKTHIDMIRDFTPELTQRLRELADNYNFLLFEDRKFADIGHVVREQYDGGIYRIASWADITNAHILPGPGVIEALHQVGREHSSGLLLVAEMSSRGTLAKEDYTQQAMEMAQLYPEFVMGFITQHKLTDHPGLLHLTPGVKLQEGGDGLGQQYRTPERAIIEQENDIIIVGRGVYGASDPANTAQIYREAAWNAYQQRLRRFLE